ncbi:hypothetical protein DSO57_1022992 [Entomophthora muscae]|uniref:Uncharacterized protein n=1 Tax=Entomophthora muscae TaxID=34485 RepID=A0ACC2T344_9FUNG|nr:hypothetical protein DSO57_1022992 [Entomophthora muscae]
MKPLSAILVPISRRQPWTITRVSKLGSRTLASITVDSGGQARKPSPSHIVFDKGAKVWHRDRSVLGAQVELSKSTDYLKDEVAQRVTERFQVIKRRFPTIVDLGSGAGHVAKFLEEGSTEKLIMCDESKLLLNRDEDVKYPVNTERVVYENEVLPFEENSIPAVISSMALHWTNDLPGILIQINRALKPDGLFLAALLGGDTLFELRTSIQLAEQERGGGLSPRVSPFAESRDATNLLTRAGFALTTVDVEDIVVEYPSMFHLIEDLEAMGDSNGILVRNPFIKRDTLIAAAAIYEAAHGNEDGTVPATFQIIHMVIINYFYIL